MLIAELRSGFLHVDMRDHTCRFFLGPPLPASLYNLTRGDTVVPSLTLPRSIHVPRVSYALVARSACVFFFLLT